MKAQRARRIRIWIEGALATISIVALILTLVAHDWIERTVGASPDQGSGETEWLLTGVALVATLIFTSVATWEWRIYRTESAAT